MAMVSRAEWDRAVWRKSSVSLEAERYVQLARVGDVIGVRDAKHPDGPVLEFTPDEIAEFRAGVMRGEFDALIW